MYFELDNDDMAPSKRRSVLISMFFVSSKDQDRFAVQEKVRIQHDNYIYIYIYIYSFFFGGGGDGG